GAMTTLGALVTQLAALAAVAFGCSLFCGAILTLGRRRLASLAPAAESRVLFAVALAPAFASGVLNAAVIFDIAALHCEAHRCMLYGARHVSPVAAALAMLFVARLSWRGVAAFRAILHTRSVTRALEGVTSRGSRGSRVVPVDEPQAFVVG